MDSNMESLLNKSIHSATKVSAASSLGKVRSKNTSRKSTKEKILIDENAADGLMVSNEGLSVKKKPKKPRKSKRSVVGFERERSPERNSSKASKAMNRSGGGRRDKMNAELEEMLTQRMNSVQSKQSHMQKELEEFMKVKEAAARKAEKEHVSRKKLSTLDAVEDKPLKVTKLGSGITVDSNGGTAQTRKEKVKLQKAKKDHDRTDKKDKDKGDGPRTGAKANKELLEELKTKLDDCVTQKEY